MESGQGCTKVYRATKVYRVVALRNVLRLPGRHNHSYPIPPFSLDEIPMIHPKKINVVGLYTFFILYPDEYPLM